MDEEKINIALDIVNEQIAELMKKYAYNKNEDADLQNKIKVLEEVKDKIYSGNIAFAEKVLQKNKEGNI